MLSHRKMQRCAGGNLYGSMRKSCKKIGPGEALVLAAEVALTQDLLQALRKELVAGHPVLATARSLATLAELWNLPPAMH